MRSKPAVSETTDAPEPTRPAAHVYADALDTAGELADERAVVDLAEDIRDLRGRLREFIEKNPGRLDLLLKGLSVLIRMVQAQYRMKGGSSEEMGDALERAARVLVDQLLPPREVDDV